MLTRHVGSFIALLVLIGPVYSHWKDRNGDELELTILSTWDGKPIDHRPAEIELQRVNESSFQMDVEAAYFNDLPINPVGPFNELQEYEAVELFLANDANQYVVIKLSPHGQHDVLLMDGAGKSIRQSLDIDYTAKIHNRSEGGWHHHHHGNNGSSFLPPWHGPHDHDNKTLPGRWFGHGRHGGPRGPPRGPWGPGRGPWGGRGRRNCWEGRAIIPTSYLPPSVTRVNAYAVHGSGENRTYEALYPVPAGEFPNPDFHRLEYFKPINTTLFLTQPVTEFSSVWLESIASPGRTEIKIAQAKVEENEIQQVPATDVPSLLTEDEAGVTTNAPSVTE